MSPQQHYETARAHQQEIVNRATSSHLGHDKQTGIGRRHTVKYRLVQAVAVLGVCAAAGTAVTNGEARSNQPPVERHATHLSAQQLTREFRAWERKGYVPTACTVSGTQLTNYSTGQSVTVGL